MKCHFFFKWHGARDKSLLDGFSLSHRAHTIFSPIFVRWRGRAPRSSNKHSRRHTRHIRWNHSQDEGDESTWWWKNMKLFYVSSFCLGLIYESSSEKIATAVGTFFFGWIAVHFTNNFGKNFVDVHLVPGRSFNERAIPGLSQSQTFHGGYFSLMLQVNFVPNQQQWHTICALDTSNLER